MRRLIFLGAILLSVVPAPAQATSTGAIEGRIVNGATDKPEAGVEVQLVGASRDGSGRVERSVTTTADGTYSFDGLRTGPEWLYVLDARYDGGLFPGRALTIPDDTQETPVLDTTLKVWDATTDPAAILIVRDDLFAIPNDDGIGVVESVVVVNQTRFAYIGRGVGGGSSSTLGLALPEDARDGQVRIEDATIDLPKVVRTDFGFAITAAVPPGETRVTYSYQLEGDSGTFDLTRTALYPTAAFSAHAAPSLDIESNRLERQGEVELDDAAYRRWSTGDPIEAGDPVQLLAVAGADLSWVTFSAAGAGLVVAIALVYFLFVRPSRAKPLGDAARPAAAEAPLENRDEVIAAIAAIDIGFENGELSQDEWEHRRTELKDKLREITAGVS